MSKLDYHNLFEESIIPYFTHDIIINQVRKELKSGTFHFCLNVVCEECQIKRRSIDLLSKLQVEKHGWHLLSCPYIDEENNPCKTLSVDITDLYLHLMKHNNKDRRLEHLKFVRQINISIRDGSYHYCKNAGCCKGCRSRDKFIEALHDQQTRCVYFGSNEKFCPEIFDSVKDMFLHMMSHKPLIAEMPKSVFEL